MIHISSCTIGESQALMYLLCSRALNTSPDPPFKAPILLTAEHRNVGKSIILTPHLS